MPADAGRLADYLRARRAQLRPEDHGYPGDPHRRVQGLKREEVANLAGISVEYYTRLEQGRTYQVSEQVLAGLTHALKLDASAAAYFYRLALPAPEQSTGRPPGPASDLLVHLVDQWSAIPVYVFDRNQDIVLINDLAKAMFPTLALAGSNAVISTFMAPAEGRGLSGWQRIARSTVAALRFHGDPADPRLREVVAELSARDPDFREMWADHDAQPFVSGTAPVLIDGFGFGEFPWQILNIPDGLFMIVWLALPNTFAADAIEHLRQQQQSHSPHRLLPNRGTVTAASSTGAADHEAIERFLDSVTPPGQRGSSAVS